MIALLAAVVAVLAALSPTTGAGFTAKISNSAGTAKAATWFTCTAAAAGDAAFFAYPLADTTGSTAADVSGNNRTGTYQGTLTRSTNKACARDTGGSVTLNGTTNYISTPTLVTGPNVFTEETWFKTTVAGGKLIGFGSSQTGASAQYDRHIYLTGTGQLVFGVYANLTVRTITSPKAYTDGTWHHSAATLSAAGMKLYVDGALVAADTTATNAEASTGYWRIGYDNLNGWTNSPANYYFTGSLAYAAVYTTALTATQIAAHYTAGLAATTTTNTAAIPAATTLNLAALAVGGAVRIAHVAGPDRIADAAASYRKAHTPAHHKLNPKRRHAPPAAPRRSPKPTPLAAGTNSAPPLHAGNWVRLPATRPRHPSAPRPRPRQPATITAPAEPTSSPGHNNRTSGTHGADPAPSLSPHPAGTSTAR